MWVGGGGGLDIGAGLFEWFYDPVFSDRHMVGTSWVWTYLQRLHEICGAEQSFQKLGDPSARWPRTEKGYFLSYTFAQGDLKWINDRMNLHNFRSYNFSQQQLLVHHLSCRKRIRNEKRKQPQTTKPQLTTTAFDPLHPWKLTAGYWKWWALEKVTPL